MYVYSLSAVSFIFGIPATGFGEGDAFEITPKGDSFNPMEGVGGDVIRCYTASKLADVKLTLLQSSPYNDFLSATYNADVISSDLGQGGAGVLPWGVKDFNGTTLISAKAMWIVKPPVVTRKDKQSNVVWEFAASDVRWFVGGQLQT